jgi:hypothetical protein
MQLSSVGGKQASIYFCRYTNLLLSDRYKTLVNTLNFEASMLIRLLYRSWQAKQNTILQRPGNHVNTVRNTQEPMIIPSKERISAVDNAS